MANTVTVKCDQCGKVNQIDAGRGGACVACGNLLTAPTSPPSPQQMYAQMQQTPQPLTITLGTSQYARNNSAGCLLTGFIFVVVIAIVAGIGVLAIDDPEGLFNSSSNEVRALDMTLLVQSDFGGVDALALSPNGRWLAYSDEDGLSLYNLETNRVYGTIETDFPAYDIGFNASSTRLFTLDGFDIVAYDIETLEIARRSEGLRSLSLQVNNAGTYGAIRQSPDATHHIVDLSTFEIVADLPVISELGLPTISISPNGDYALLVHPDAYRLIDLRTNSDIPLGFTSIEAGMWAGDEDTLFVSDDQTVHRITLLDGVATIERDYQIPEGIFSLSNEPIAVSQTGDSMALIMTGLTDFYRYAAGDDEAKATGKTANFIRQMVITEDFVITADNQGRVQRWD